MEEESGGFDPGVIRKAVQVDPGVKDDLIRKAVQEREEEKAKELAQKKEAIEKG